MMDETAVCRNCGLKLIGKPYHLGGSARHPETKEVCNSSFWGGFVCSDSCDGEINTIQKQSIDIDLTTRGI